MDRAIKGIQGHVCFSTADQKIAYTIQLEILIPITADDVEEVFELRHPVELP